jgi:hypothetical protein
MVFRMELRMKAIGVNIYPKMEEVIYAKIN